VHVPPSFRLRDVGAGGAPVPLSRRKGKEKEKTKEKAQSPERDWGVDDDDVIIIDSD
jgi:ubiquitin fusion degradation protein 1